MQAVRLHPSGDPALPFSVLNPAPSSALVLDTGLPIPQPLKPGELLVKIMATTIIRDALTWPETYEKDFTVLGHDFAGTVVAIADADSSSTFSIGDQVYGMTSASRAGTWAEYAIVLTEEACLKPPSLTWAQAAVVPLSGLTAYQALFEHARMALPSETDRGTLARPDSSCVLITGASGCVGLYLVQLARWAGLHVTAATSSTGRNMDLLKRLGADEVVQYNDLSTHSRRYDIVIDTVGGGVLRNCWQFVKNEGSIISIDSASYDFVEKHQQERSDRGCERVKALFFIVESSSQDLSVLSRLLQSGLLEPFVAQEFPLADVRSAYDRSSMPSTSRGKVVLTVSTAVSTDAETN